MSWRPRLVMPESERGMGFEIILSALGGVAAAGVVGLAWRRARPRSPGPEEARAARLAAAVEGLTDGFALWDAEGRLVACNEAYRQNVPASEEDVVPGAELATVVRRLARSGAVRIDREPEVWAEERLATPGAVQLPLWDGRTLLIRDRRMPDGGVVCLVMDVTGRLDAERRMREAKESAELASRAKTEFLANMSHELRTPLNAVIGFAEMALMQLHGPLLPVYRENLENIRRSGIHLLDIVTDILDVSRIEVNALELDERPVDIGNIVSAALSLVAQRAARGRKRLFEKVPADLPRVQADPLRVRQALVNLLSNAVKFTPDGGEVGVEVEMTTDGGLTLSVKDTGIGMAPEDIPKALKPFSQLEPILERRHEGTGLGLYLTDRLVRLQGGSLELESRKGEGTRAIIRFPADRLRMN